jgi:hypothetical protein
MMRRLKPYDHKGEKNPDAKLTSATVKEIYARCWNSESAYVVAGEYGLAGPTVSAIKHGKRWSHVTCHNRYFAAGGV